MPDGHVRGGLRKGWERMERKQKKQYQAPRVTATYAKERLDKAVRPHGQGAVGNYVIIDGDNID